MAIDATLPVERNRDPTSLFSRHSTGELPIAITALKPEPSRARSRNFASPNPFIDECEVNEPVPLPANRCLPHRNRLLQWLICRAVVHCIQPLRITAPVSLRPSRY